MFILFMKNNDTGSCYSYKIDKKQLTDYESTYKRNTSNNDT